MCYTCMGNARKPQNDNKCSYTQNWAHKREIVRILKLKRSTEVGTKSANIFIATFYLEAIYLLKIVPLTSLLRVTSSQVY